MRMVTVAAVVKLLYTIVINVSGTSNIVDLYTEPYILNSSIPKALM